MGVIVHRTPASSEWAQLCVKLALQSISLDTVLVQATSSITMGPLPEPKRAEEKGVAAMGGNKILPQIVITVIYIHALRV